MSIFNNNNFIVKQAIQLTSFVEYTNHREGQVTLHMSGMMNTVHKHSRDILQPEKTTEYASETNL